MEFLSWNLVPTYFFPIIEKFHFERLKKSFKLKLNKTKKDHVKEKRIKNP